MDRSSVKILGLSLLLLQLGCGKDRNDPLAVGEKAGTQGDQVASVKLRGQLFQIDGADTATALPKGLKKAEITATGEIEVSDWVHKVEKEGKKKRREVWKNKELQIQSGQFEFEMPLKNLYRSVLKDGEGRYVLLHLKVTLEDEREFELVSENPKNELYYPSKLLLLDGNSEKMSSEDLESQPLGWYLVRPAPGKPIDVKSDNESAQKLKGVDAMVKLPDELTFMEPVE